MKKIYVNEEYSNRRKLSKREIFLNQMDEIIPWKQWVDIIRPYYPDGKRGRPPIPIETMLRMYLLQIWFKLSDEGVENEIYDSYAMKQFMHINFLEDQVPDATTLLHFRHLLEEHSLGQAMFHDVHDRLERAGLIMRGGSILDATLIDAPSSTKNREGKRDPEMHSTKKGNNYRFGMKVNAAVDPGSGYVHTITGTAANKADIAEAANLIRPDDEVVYADSGYLGIEKRPEIREDEHLSQIDYRIVDRPSRLKMTTAFKGVNWDKQIESRKASVRCKVEHPFRIVKNLFGYCKTAYRGIKKNMNRFYMLFGSANMLMCIWAGREKEFQRA